MRANTKFDTFLELQRYSFLLHPVSSPATAPFKAQRHSQLGLRFHQKDCSNVTAALQLLHTGASQTMVTTATPHRVTSGSDNKGVLVSLSPRLAAQCGYSLTVDFLGNAKFLASVLSCLAQNTNDETYKLTVQISVFSNSAMTSASSYVQSMTCLYSPWAEREILCERNYMEVSVRRGVPLIEPNFVQDDPDWSLAYPEIQTVPMAVLRSTTFYKQRWMVMMVDTAVTCPTDGTAFTEQMITWNVPRVLPPLVPTPQITTLDVQMGVDGCKLDPATIHNRDYKLDVGPQLITSHVLDNTYVISYSIEPMLEHTWQDGPEKTKYTVLHPITTPFMPRPPVVTNNCFTNGTMAALAVKVESVPSLSPSQLILRDPSCRPLQSDAINADFYFNVNSCGTTRRVSIDTFKTIEEVQHIDKFASTPLDRSGCPW
ncbi:UNVERIFIED_CONTAM: hypothetical protein FKN15_058847 [Acipenser sinensis]